MKMGRTIASLREKAGRLFSGRYEADDPQEEWRLDLEALLARIDRLEAACRLWDQGFIEGEQFTPEQFLAWVNANWRAAREALGEGG